MKTVTVEKSLLIWKIKDNRTHHRDEFLSALEVCKLEVERDLRDFADGIKSGKKDSLKNYYSFEIPVDHTGDYDQALAILEWEQGESVTLTAEEFKNYIQDEWNWTATFKGTNSTYLSGRR